MATVNVIVCGDREWTDEAKIRDRLALLPKNAVVIHGDARGADRLAGYFASKLGLTVIACPANWEKYGKKAGPLRNQHMLSHFAPTRVIAFHSNIAASKGTRDMLRIAANARIPTEVIK